MGPVSGALVQTAAETLDNLVGVFAHLLEGVTVGGEGGEEVGSEHAHGRVLESGGQEKGRGKKYRRGKEGKDDIVEEIGEKGNKRRNGRFNVLFFPCLFFFVFFFILLFVCCCCFFFLQRAVCERALRLICNGEGARGGG